MGKKTFREIQDRYRPKILVAKHPGSDAKIYLLGTVHITTKDFLLPIQSSLNAIYKEIDYFASEDNLLAGEDFKKEKLDEEDLLRRYQIDLAIDERLHFMEVDIYNQVIDRCSDLTVYSLDTQETGEVYERSREITDKELRALLEEKRDRLFAARILSVYDMDKTQLVVMGQSHIAGVCDQLVQLGFKIKEYKPNLFFKPKL